MTLRPSDLLKRHGVVADKRFGQHFLLDLNFTRRIARAGGPLDEGGIVEIGPGPAALTIALIEEGARRVTAVEMDDRLTPLLKEVADWADSRLQVMFADALKTPIVELGPTPRRIVPGRPHNVGSPLIIHWLDAVAAFGPEALSSATIMLQEEVVDRIVAPPGSRAYGRLSVVVQAIADVNKLFSAPARAFTPPPKVSSAVVRLDMRGWSADAPPWPRFKAVVAAAFGQRRKTLRNSLKAVSPQPAALCQAAGVDPNARAEVISIDGFKALAQALGEAA